MTLTIEQQREEIYNYLIQEYHYLTHDQITQMVDQELKNNN